MRTIYKVASLLIVLSVSATASAQKKYAPAQADQLYWYDGMQKRFVQESTEQVLLPDSTGRYRLMGDKSSALQSNKAMAVYLGYSGKRSLPGGVIIKFAASWSQADIDSWLASQGFDSFKPLVGDYIWFADTVSGIQSLLIANKIHESGEVVFASPNWWTEVEKR